MIRARNKEMNVRGRDVVSGLPKSIRITSDETVDAMRDTLDAMIAAAKEVLSETPPELASDDRSWIVITGGGALFDGLETLFAEELTVPVMIADTPL